MIRVLFIAIILACSFENAFAKKKDDSPYKVCGKFLQCGIFQGPAVTRGGADQDKEVSSLSLVELVPGVVTFIVNQERAAEHMRVFSLVFKDDGTFKVNFWRYFEFGEGSCSNFVCRFSVSDSEYRQDRQGPPIEVTGTISFANGQVMRSDIRTIDEKPFFATGVLENKYCGPNGLAFFAKETGKNVTEFSCLRWVENQLRVRLSKIFRKH